MDGVATVVAAGLDRRVAVRRMGLAIGTVVVLLAVAAWVAYLPLDSGDNYCGNVFVAHGRNSGFNGCDERLLSQRIVFGGLLVAAAGFALVAVGLRRAARSARAHPESR